ncbi:MAG TPA: flagellar biosynthetic protein FliO [Methylibium sp.]
MASTSLSILWFVVIVAMIPLALWLLKRSPYGATLGAAGSGGITRVVSAMPLSPSQRIVTIEVGAGDARQWLVLGVTPQSITTLHQLAPQQPPAAPALNPAASFASLLHKLQEMRSNDGSQH